MTILKQLLIKFINFLFPFCCINCNTLIQDNFCLCHNCWIKLNFIFPPYCKICGKNYNNIDNLIYCGNCLIKKYHFDQIRVLFKFDEFSKKIIHKLKYYDKRSFATMFARLWSNRYLEFLDTSDIIIPVPINKLKRIIRSYNQTQLLGEEISKIIKKPLILNALLKNKITKSQSSLSQKERMKNITTKDFVITNNETIKNKNILLIDDVITTGTTINVCSKLLKHNGANKVLVLAIACT